MENRTTFEHFGQSLARPLCVETKAPSWIELLPVGYIEGRDGRSWNLTNPQTVLTAFLTDNKALPVDYEHSTEIKGPRGEKAPAVGWIEELALVEGLIMGRVVWTEEGKEAVSKREYRYVSPVFTHTKNGEVVRLTSVGLTNQPNLHLKALNNEQKGESMTKISESLGLAEGASEELIVAQIKALQTQNAQHAKNAQEQTLNNVVPRTEYDASQTRALNAEKALKEYTDAEREKSINSAIDDAISTKKIIPASKDYFLSMCRTENGLDEFKKFVASSPAMLEPSGLDGKEPEGSGGTVLSEVEKATCRQLGVSEADFLKSKKEGE